MLRRSAGDVRRSGESFERVIKNMKQLKLVSEPNPTSPRRKRRRPVFYLAAVALGVLPFLALEVALRVFGVGDDVANAELHAGFGNVAPLFQLDETQQAYQTNHVKEQFFVTDSFAATKPKDEFRIFCLGGSTVQGRPYRPETSFGEWLELELNAIDGSHKYKVVNCGGISYASYRLRPVLKEVLNYQPDLIVLATGHNEFLEDRTYDSVKSRSGFRMRLEDSAKSLHTVMLLRKLVGGAPRLEPQEETTPLPNEVETRLDDDAGYASYHRDKQWRDEVCEEYDVSVTDMVETCQAAGVPVYLVKLGANLRDCPPFKSEHKDGLSVEDEQGWQELFDEATAVAEKDGNAALKLYQQAAKIDDEYPLLHFRIARTLDQLGRFDEALVSYKLALDQDICPLRLTTPIAERLEAIASKYSVPLVDAESAIAAFSSQQITGYDAYIDHVHPTIGAHQKIAQQTAALMVESGLVSKADHLTSVQRRQLYQTHIQQLEPTYYSNGRRRIGWLEGWARRKRLYDETLPVDARGYVATALRYLDLHRFDDAFGNMTNAVALSEDAVGMFVSAAADIFQQGRSYESKWILEHLQQCSLTDTQLEAVDLGLLVMALENGQSADVDPLLKKHTEQWPRIVADDKSGWATVIPNLSELIQQATALPP
ncbi:MAG: GDSL-type esterase/lipase family protein [Fuerstiella sp.]